MSWLSYDDCKIYDLIPQSITLGWLRHSSWSNRFIDTIDSTGYRKPVECSNGKIYNSMREAVSDTKVSQRAIIACCDGNGIKKSYGMTFRWAKYED